jgi:hypothetical protein
MPASRLILIEFNELCPALLQNFMDRGLLPNFRLHQVFHLGDGRQLHWKCLGELLSDAGCRSASAAA